MSATLEFMGSATCLPRLGEFTLLTDPNFLHRGQRANLGRGALLQAADPPLTAAGLPSLDAVALSHRRGCGR